MGLVLMATHDIIHPFVCPFFSFKIAFLIIIAVLCTQKTISVEGP